MITTTLNRIRTYSPCTNGWIKLLNHLGKTQADDAPLAFATILESNGLDDALWCCRVEPSINWRKLAVAFTSEVRHLMTDPRSLDALDVAGRYAEGLATDEELATARNAAMAAARSPARGPAWAAAWAATWDTAWDAARDAASAAASDAARDAASAAARDAARNAARAAARNAARDAARGPASAAARDAASAAARINQIKIFKEFIK